MKIFSRWTLFGPGPKRTCGTGNRLDRTRVGSGQRPLAKNLFTKLLASEIEFLHARGQLADLHDYLRRFPDHASEAGGIYRDSIQRGVAITGSSSRELSGRVESGGAPTGDTRQVGEENTPAAVSRRPLHPEANTHDDTFIFSFKRRAKMDPRQKQDGRQT